MSLSEKAIVCACEDVSVHDIDEAIAHGFADIESLKRYTGLGTGPCEGKECMVHCARMVALANGGDESKVLPFTSRPAPTLRIAIASSMPPSTESCFWKTCIVTRGWCPSASSVAFV